MQFFENHFTIRNIWRAPHKWLFAFLLSPIHYGQLHYKKKYHLKYGHAKKLFVFDLLLLVSTIVIGTMSVVWYFYDPTITSQVYLSVDVSPDRLQSGEVARVSISYRNDSDQILMDPQLSIRLPAGFILLDETTSSTSASNQHLLPIPVSELHPGYENSVSLEVQAILVPEDETIISADLSYTPQASNKPEFKSVHYGITARGSVITTSIETPEQLLDTQSVELKMKVENTGEHTVRDISIPLPLPEFTELQKADALKGYVTGTTWIIQELTARESTEIILTVSLKAPRNLDEIVFDALPLIAVRDTLISQTKFSQKSRLIHPSVHIGASWNKTGVRPGNSAELSVNVSNNGDVDLQDVVLSFPILDAIVNRSALATQNNGKVQQNTFVVSAEHVAELKSLRRGQSAAIRVTVPIVTVPSGATNLQLSFPVSAGARVEAIPSARIKDDAQTSPLRIGTQLIGSAQVRYYTNEGDQLGRGPLPPIVGSQTKYWAFVTIQNTTSRADDVIFSAQLPVGIEWTGKTSVSQGEDISFNSGTRTVRWTTRSLESHATAGLYMELAFTPTASLIGTVPTMLTNMRVEAYDSHVEERFERAFGLLKGDLKEDGRALEKGVLVQPI